MQRFARLTTLATTAFSLMVAVSFLMFSGALAANTNTNATPTATPQPTATATPTPSPSLLVIAPNGGEQWLAGSTYHITWSVSGVQWVNIRYKNSAGSSWVIAQAIAATAGDFTWSVPALVSAGSYTIEISDAAYNGTARDSSNGPFTISAPITPSPSPTPTPSVSPTPAVSPRPSPTPTVSPTPAVTPSPAPTASPSPRLSPSPSPTAVVSPTPTVSPSPRPSPTVTPTPTPRVSPSPAVSPSPTPTARPRPSPTVSPTPTASPRPTPSVVPTSASGVAFMRGDANLDGRVDIADPQAIQGYLYLNGKLGCLDAADTNDNGRIEAGDYNRLYGFLFTGTHPAPPAPFPRVGTDPTADKLGCERGPQLATRPSGGGEVAAPKFLRGDANGDGKVNQSDTIAITSFVNGLTTTIACQDAADVDDDGWVSIFDAVRLQGFLFLGSHPAPAAPYAQAGTDPTADDLDCGT